MKSEVYFAKVESSRPEDRGAALEKLLDKVAPFAGYRKDEFIPVKITVGDSPCVYHVSPELVKTVIRKIKQKQAKPFLFDTSVIYQGQRQNAIDHMNLVQSKGFGQAQVGAPFIVADGIFGRDGLEYKIEGKDIKKIKIPSFIGMLENLVVLSHATGHIVSGYAGAIKNVAMGMSCRATKQMQHSSLKPSVIEKKCTACGCCIAICPVRAISWRKEKANIDQKACVGCAECICACKFDAIYINWQEDPVVFCRRMADVAKFTLSKFKNKFFVTFAFDITKECDCISSKDEKMVAQNLGILASYDIVSLDKATADLASKYKTTDFLIERRKIYEEMFAYAAENGLGSTDYNLITI